LHLSEARIRHEWTSEFYEIPLIDERFCKRMMMSVSTMDLLALDSPRRLSPTNETIDLADSIGFQHGVCFSENY